ncbi:DUF5668 domain-containing protein [Sphaerobacter sp.]|uniref:LiaF transmembrane domain-containing protein n=1 Tax=Sphaerobacter sp. TaxID=2099654 RepID=UPI001D4EF946|nr:DUF5668 domain-containing protein [Sphaerobacter sp.]MBX5444623.1 hypothetical protein [Sphaerobacter sp.]
MAREFTGRALIGLLLVLLGALLLLQALGGPDIGRIISDWWPVAIIAVGLAQLAASRHTRVVPAILIAIGLVLLASTTGLIPGSIWSLFWPLVLIAIGLFVILRHGPRRVSLDPADSVGSFVIFGGNDIVNRSEDFQGGWAAALFGGITLDLRQAELLPAGATIDAYTAFGGIDILVPRGWNIAITGLPIFGGYEDKTHQDEPLPPDAPTLTVNAVCLFGGVTVKHER